MSCRGQPDGDSDNEQRRSLAVDGHDELGLWVVWLALNTRDAAPTRVLPRIGHDRTAFIGWPDDGFALPKATGCRAESGVFPDRVPDSRTSGRYTTGASQEAHRPAASRRRRGHIVAGAEPRAVVGRRRPSRTVRPSGARRPPVARSASFGGGFGTRPWSARIASTSAVRWRYERNGDLDKRFPTLISAMATRPNRCSAGTRRPCVPSRGPPTGATRDDMSAVAADDPVEGDTSAGSMTRRGPRSRRRGIDSIGMTLRSDSSRAAET